jgi:hypothetical protein
LNDVLINLESFNPAITGAAKTPQMLANIKPNSFLRRETAVDKNCARLIAPNFNWNRVKSALFKIFAIMKSDTRLWQHKQQPTLRCGALLPEIKSLSIARERCRRR